MYDDVQSVLRNQFDISICRAHTHIKTKYEQLKLIKKMGSTTILLAVVAVVVMVSYTEAANNCPLPSKVYGCSPKCVQDYECTNGKVCCSNACNAKSCTQPAANGVGSHSSNKYQSGGGAGQYCDNVKCNSFEVCKLDPSTKRMKCSRP